MPRITATLQDPAFYLLLQKYDADLAESVRQGKCPHPGCGGVLHSACYPRVPTVLHGPSSLKGYTAHVLTPQDI
jgi:hypothetical protein